MRQALKIPAYPMCKMPKKPRGVFLSGSSRYSFTYRLFIFTASLRASEINADCILKATKVDGIYDKDPMKFKDAVKYDNISYMQAIEKRLAVMDSTAFSMCMDNKIPIIVFDMCGGGNIKKVVEGEPIGTLVS